MAKILEEKMKIDDEDFGAQGILVMSARTPKDMYIVIFESHLPFLELLLLPRNGSRGSYVGSSPATSVERK